MNKTAHEQNRRSWNFETVVHNQHKLHQAEYFRAGGSTLFPEELELLGDIHGKRLVHLQCNSGQDTLSLVRKGALVTGVDISDEAIAFAKQLATDSGLCGEFIRADVYDWFEQAAQEPACYEVAFSSYGVICWLSDLETWAEGIYSILEPGGRFVLLDFHPFLNMLDDGWHLAYSYAEDGELTLYPDGIGDYVAMSGELLAISGYEAFDAPHNPHAVYEFTWSVSAICSALINAGLRLTRIIEYPYLNGCRMLPCMQELPGRRLIPPPDVPHNLPLMLGMAADKPGA